MMDVERKMKASGYAVRAPKHKQTRTNAFFRLLCFIVTEWLGLVVSKLDAGVMRPGTLVDHISSGAGPGIKR